MVREAAKAAAPAPALNQKVKVLETAVEGIVAMLEADVAFTMQEEANIASVAGKAGIAGGATYCATKHAVVGLTEALRQELRGTGVELSVVMPVVVNTELGSGLPETRAFKRVQPEDVADAIVEALQTGRFEVYVPRNVSALARMNALFPRRVMEAYGRMLKGDQVLMAPDHAARAAYEARMVETIAEKGPAIVSTSEGVMPGQPEETEAPPRERETV